MIFTLTLNPAIDKTIEIKTLKVGCLNRINSIRSDASGKGINVSKVIDALGGESIALGFLGGNNGAYIRKKVREMGIKESFIEIQEETRMNIKIVDKIKKNVTELNEKGPHITKDEIIALKKTLKTQIKKNDFLIISGSAPPNLSDSIYRDLIQLLPPNVKVILDADELLLEKALEAKPYMIKPNFQEFQRLIGNKSVNTSDIMHYAKAILKKGPETILVSMGEKGAIFVGKEKKYLIEPIQVEIKSSIGAGDAMVGGFVFSLSQNKPLIEALKLASASAAASVSMEGTQPGTKDLVNELQSKIKIQKLEEK